MRNMHFNYCGARVLGLKSARAGADARETDNICILISNIIIPVCREKNNFERKLYQTVVRRRMEN